MSFQITYTMTESMDALRVSRATLYELIQQQKLRTYKIGRRRYCTHDAIVECQHSLEVEADKTA